MNQNEKHNEVIVGICHDAVLLTEIWGAFQKLFEDYVEEVIAALTPVAEALAGPILFGNEPPDLSEEELERLIRTVDNSQHLNTPQRVLRGELASPKMEEQWQKFLEINGLR